MQQSVGFHAGILHRELVHQRRVPAPQCYSGLIPAALMIFAHLIISARRYFENSSGPSPAGSKPSAMKRSLISGACMILTTSRLIAAIAFFGAPAGMKSPYQLAAS